MVYYVSVRKRQKSYYKNTKKRRKNTRKNTRKNKYRGGAITMNGMPLAPRRRTNLHPPPPPPPQRPRGPYNVLFGFTSGGKPEFMIYLVNNMLKTLLETIDSYIQNQKLPTVSTNRQKLEKFRIIVDNVITKITTNPDGIEDNIYDNMVSDGNINDPDFISLLRPMEEKMYKFIDNTTEFVPFQEEAKKIATNVINWINQAVTPGESFGNFTPAFIASYRENGIWSMFGNEGKKIVEDAEDEIGG